MKIDIFLFLAKILEGRMKRKGVANIDILPMACIGLLLVVMMIMVAPMVMSHTRVPVVVPSAHTAERKVEDDVAIALTQDGRLFLQDVPIDKKAIGEAIAKIISQDPYRLVVVRADKEVFYDDVLEILSLAKQAGAKRIACATKKK
ncbi:MAG: biopolymer transporter ExbD [candidate division WOR-3 bacterium]